MNKYSISIILIIFLALIITPVIAASSTDYNGFFSGEISSDDGAFTVKSSQGSIISLFDNQKNLTAWSYDIHRNIGSVAISPDNKFIAVGSDGGLIWLFDQKGTVVWNKTFGNARIKSIEFSKDSQYLDASNFLNQAFYITIEGNPAIRQVSPTVSAIASVVPSTTSAQISSDLDLSWIESLFRNNLNLLLGIVIGLCLAGIVWYTLSRCEYREKGIFRLIRNVLTLRNFTIFSILLMLIGFLPSVFSLENFRVTFESIFVIGLWCFLLGYFLYAVKCWGATSQICALLMVTIPLLAYSLAITKIPDSITNIGISLILQFCFYAIISAILLYVIDKVKMGLKGIFFKGNRRSHGYFEPHMTYAFIGMVVVSVIAVNFGGVVLISDNSNKITGSIQNTPSQININSPTQVSSPTTTYQNFQIIPTIASEIIDKIEKSVSNPEPAIDIPSLEKQIHVLINQQRTSRGLSALSYDSSLSSIARKHSADMAQNNFFSHYNLQGLGPTERGNVIGYSCYKNYGSYYTTGIPENIMQNNLYDSVTYYNGIPRYAWNSQEELAQSTVTGWMNSPGHRQNILTSTYDREGIGIAIATDDKVYITEDFC